VDFQLTRATVKGIDKGLAQNFIQDGYFHHHFLSFSTIVFEAIGLGLEKLPTMWPLTVLAHVLLGAPFLKNLES